MLADESSGMNRRETFRLDDMATLRVRVVNDEDILGIEADFNAYRSRYCMKSQMQNHKEQRKPRLIRIRKVSPDVAIYLENLEQQISEIAQRMDEVSNASLEGHEFSGQINISATGVRFCTTQQLELDQTLEIGIVLGLSKTQIVVLGKVNRVDEQSDNERHVSVQYTHIHPEDEETVIHHLARLQQMELQSRRDANEQ